MGLKSWSPELSLRVTARKALVPEAFPGPGLLRPSCGRPQQPLTRHHPNSTTQGGAACSSPWLRLETSKGLSIIQHSTCLHSHRSSRSKKGGGRNKGGRKRGGGGEEKRGWKNGERGKDAKKGRGRREGPSEKAPTAAATLAVREGKGLGGATGSGESRQKPSSTRGSGDSGSCLQVGAPTKEETLNVTVIQFYFKILRQTVRGNLQLPIIMTASAY